MIFPNIPGNEFENKKILGIPKKNQISENSLDDFPKNVHSQKKPCSLTHTKTLANPKNSQENKIRKNKTRKILGLFSKKIPGMIIPKIPGNEFENPGNSQKFPG